MKTITNRMRILVSIITLIGFNSIAQVSFTPQYMGRSEYRHGYQSLADTNQNAAAFVSQRARLTGEYKTDKYKFVIGVQDVRTWGSVANAAIDTKGFLSVSEAYGELMPTNKFSFKFGRQILSYDDDRIIGSLDWAMQSRRHDAGVFKYTDSTTSVHLGVAYNQDKEQNKSTFYTTTGNYKTLQYLWANKQFGKSSLSFLFLNNGNQFVKVNSNGTKDTMLTFSQTIGLREAYKAEKLGVIAYAYFQTGKDAVNRDLSAYDVSLEATYSVVKKLSLTLGGEILSGTSQTDTANKVNNSFTPLYGTNHRFNGYMDYFYVGNHANSVGLIDGYLKVNFIHNDLLLGLNTHLFSAAAAIRDTKTTNIQAMSSSLGIEIDFTISYKITNDVSFQGGYSQVMGSNSMVAIKGGNTSVTSNWAYAMLIIRPGKIKWPKTGLKM